MLRRSDSLRNVGTDTTCVPQTQVSSPPNNAKAAKMREPRDTGFPEPFHDRRNTTLPHPEADLSSDATISHEDVAGELALKRHRLSFLSKRKKTICHGFVNLQIEPLHSGVALPLIMGIGSAGREPPKLNFAQDIAKIEVGKNWPYSFVRRNRDKLGCTWFDGLDMARRKADSASRYKDYFELIRAKIEKYDILPCNTYNVDEKGFLLGVINRTKRVFSLNVKKQGKLLGAAQDGNRSWITFLACICQDMTSLPPFLIYQGKPGQVQDSWLSEFEPEHQSAFFTTSETGWTNHELGKEWLIGVFDRFTKAKARNGRDYRLLITDGHSSHVNMDFLEWCDQHRIIVAVFPPHSTHRLQPLDVSLFSPLSTAYTKQLIQWTAKTQGLISLSKREFWTLFWNAFEASFSPENIASGWERTGLLPLDPEVVLSQISEKTRDDSDTGGDSAESLALQRPTARDLRRLVDKAVDHSSSDAGRSSRKLKSTLESLQSEVELLRYENQGLRETIIHEKQRRQRGKALKDYLFDRIQSRPFLLSPP
ncbi:Arginine--tRNA ligase, cytoplasmic-like protein [Purpureocillium lavendulum]|uniref:Arginine--tRNA ligase, cytoplasmic-like protein n=1 Tax=Purpureocillium lavendulum TaxID=1247861 RepID=A0AB34FC09_9HYPO|nr:Arginine--tRNA ligase, cytoplasmic-like protein [Purpureocillium lavendulum]